MSKDAKTNDKYYIGPKPSQKEIDRALEMFQTHRMQSIKEDVTYREAIKEYRIYIRMIAELLNELKLPNNPLYYSIVLQRMIYRGYCSLKEYKYVYDVQDILTFTSGINIIAGEGVCRNSTCFIEDVLKKLDFPTEKFYCNCQSTSRQRKAKPANHVLNIITIDGIKYGYDSTNQFFLRFINDSDLRTYLPTGEEVIFHFKPYAFLALEGITQDIPEKMRTYRNASLASQISDEEVYEIIVRSTELINKNEEAFNMFKDHTQERKQKILTLTQKETNH